MQTPQLQQSASTSVARYWNVYSVLRRYFSSDRNLKILSFGCSTGEELVTLRTLFPSADLFGCDTDWYNLQCARAMLKRSALVFHSSDQEVAQTSGSFTDELYGTRRKKVTAGRPSSTCSSTSSSTPASRRRPRPA